MSRPEEIEAALGRLMPRGISETGLARMVSTLEELAAESGGARSPIGRVCRGVGLAAVVILISGVWYFHGLQQTSPDPGVAVAVAGKAELLEDMEGVVSAEEHESFVEDGDGTLHRAWHVRVVSEERFRDLDSGRVVKVVSPRDELVLMPVSAF